MWLGDWEGAAEQHGLAAAQRRAGYSHFEAMALCKQALMLIQAGQPEPAARVLEAAIALEETYQPRAPVMRALWALTFARLGQDGRGWEVLGDAFATDEWSIFMEEACYWVEWFLSEVRHAWEAAVLLSFVEVRRDSERWWTNGLNDSPAHLRTALEGALGSALPEAMAAGRAWTLPGALGMLRDLAARETQ